MKVFGLSALKYERDSKSVANKPSAVLLWPLFGFSIREVEAYWLFSECLNHLQSFFFMYTVEE